MLKYYEEITRSYVNGVKITYEIVDNENIYLHSVVTNSVQKRGYGTEAMKEFMQSFSHSNIYLFSSNELGTEKEILDKWYERLGFEKQNNLSHIPYNVTHCYKNNNPSN